MKLRSLMMCVISGLLTMALAYVPVVKADGNNADNNKSQSTPADQTQNGSSSQDNSNNNQDNNDQTPDQTNDQNGTPDTVTGGDDDY
jgi:cytoskeletal protein RodZ